MEKEKWEFNGGQDTSEDVAQVPASEDGGLNGGMAKTDLSTSQADEGKEEPEAEQGDGEASGQQPKKLTKKETVMQALKFLFFSVGAGIIQIITFTIMVEGFGLKGELVWISTLVSLILSVLYNFTLNRRYTFKSASNVPKAMLLVALFYAVFTPVSTWFVQKMTTIWTAEGMKGADFLAQAISMVANLVLEFLYQKFLVFRKSANTNDIAKKQRQKQ